MFLAGWLQAACHSCRLLFMVLQAVSSMMHTHHIIMKVAVYPTPQKEANCTLTQTPSLGVPWPHDALATCSSTCAHPSHPHPALCEGVPEHAHNSGSPAHQCVPSHRWNASNCTPTQPVHSPGGKHATQSTPKNSVCT